MKRRPPIALDALDHLLLMALRYALPRTISTGEPDREVIAAYAVATLANGEIDVEVMDGDDLERIRTFATKNGTSSRFARPFRKPSPRRCSTSAARKPESVKNTGMRTA